MWFAVATAALFTDVTSETLGSTGEWSNKVRMADIDNDGDLDVLFANGGDYRSPGTPEVNRVFVNEAGVFTELALPNSADLCRSLVVGDLDGDGWNDLVIAGAYETPSTLLLGSAMGFSEVSGMLPSAARSIGDIELGDVDGDGDLDAILADWGPGDPFVSAGRTRLWLNEDGVFSDVTALQMPDVLVSMSWDLTLADVDGDFDLDVLVSSKNDAGSYLFLNDGRGTFEDASERLPMRSDNYVFAAMDLDSDGDVDLMTVNDGSGLRERVLLNDGEGRFTDATDAWLPGATNAGEDDNAILFFDADDDGDPDAVIGSLTGDDRWLRNDEDRFTLMGSAFDGTFTSGTLGLAVGDVDGDGRLDVAMAQGELADDERFYLGNDVSTDSTGPIVVVREDGEVLRVRVHDRQFPVRASDLVVVHRGEVDTPLTWLGGTLFGTAQLPQDGEVCAADRTGNETCVALDPPTPAVTQLPTEGPEGGCDTGVSRVSVWLWCVLLAWRRRRGPGPSLVLE